MIQIKPISNYLQTLRDNFHGEHPILHKIALWGVPTLGGFIGSQFYSDLSSDSMISSLIDIHGILLSVLIASYAPFLDFVGKPPAEKSTPANRNEYDPTYDVLRSQAGVKRMLFAANSLSIILSISILVILCITKLCSSEYLYKPFSLKGINVFIGPKPFLSFLLYFAVTLNFSIVFRTVYIISEFVFDGMNESKNP